MKKTKNNHQYFAIDESGDPVFFNHKKENIIGNGASKILILGFVTTQDVDKLRGAVNSAKKIVVNDKLLSKKISDKAEFFFHAKADQADVKKVFIDSLIKSEFKCQFIVARKNEVIFNERHSGKENIFYDEMISILLKNVLHKSTINTIYFAKRSSRLRQGPLTDTVKKGINRFEDFTNSKVKNQNNIEVQIPLGEPLLQVIDYMLWVIYRCYTKPNDKSVQAYLEVLKDKISLVYDIYSDSEDTKHKIFNKKNQFHPTKITPLELD
jgi:hypothetical protein